MEARDYILVSVCETGGHKFGVIRVSATVDQVVKASLVRVTEFRGATAITVGCVRRGTEFISLVTGPCSDKIREAFGVTLPDAAAPAR